MPASNRADLARAPRRRNIVNWALAISPIVGAASNGYAACAALPHAIEAFVERRESCDHFRGEDPYDAGRAAFLDARFREFCEGTDADLRALKRKYALEAEIMAVLARYEASVEM